MEEGRIQFSPEIISPKPMNYPVGKPLEVNIYFLLSMHFKIYYKIIFGKVLFKFSYRRLLKEEGDLQTVEKTLLLKM